MSDIYYEFGVNVLRDSENAGPTAAEVRMAREIERLRSRVEDLEKALTEIAEYCFDADPTVSTIEYAVLRALGRDYP
jgi:hypothetical protein